jgi:hypothetical protein
MGAVEVTLDLLKECSDVIPIPWFNAVVGAACKVLAIAEVWRSFLSGGLPFTISHLQDVKGNFEEAKRLADNTCAIMLVVMQSLKGKAEDSIDAETLLYLERLSKWALDLPALIMPY